MSEPFMGEIKLIGFTFAPRDWAFCSGQILSISSNQALFALLGTTWGGDGRSTFALPDLRGRIPIGQGAGTGLSTHTLGARGGAERVSLDIGSIPNHTHEAIVTTSNDAASVPISVELSATTEEGDSATPVSGAYLAQALPPTGGKDLPELIYKTSAPASDTTVPLGGVSASAGPVSVDVSVSNANTGGGAAHNNMQPYLAINYVIALQGLFPSRN